MDWNELRAVRISEWVIKALKTDQRIELKDTPDKIREEIELEIKRQFQEEKNLTEEVYQMMDQLEAEGHQFDRQTMFPLLKKQLIKKKGLVL